MTNQPIVRNQTDLSADVLDPWYRAAQDWLGNLTSERTRNAYIKAWRDFLAYVGIHPGDVTQTHVIGYRHALQQPQAPGKRPLSNSTINLKLAALSSFYQFAQERNLIDYNPVAGVKRLPVKPYGRASWLDPDSDQDKILLAQPDRDTLIGKRDYAILLVLLTTGVRVSAIADATVEDLRRGPTGGGLAYTNKGGKQETAKLVRSAFEAIHAYLRARGPVAFNAPLFVTSKSHHTNFEQRKLTRHTITRMVSRHAKNAGLHHVTAHSLRHTAALVAEKYTGVAGVKNLLKHSDTRVTSIYLDHIGDSGKAALLDAMADRYS